MAPERPKLSALRVTVGVAAVVAPLLHSATDLMEWLQHGFSVPQLWLNYAAFLPMPWLLLGLFVVCEGELGVLGLAGALLYGAAFTYFTHTTLYALALRSPDYASLWQQLGPVYTVHGACMVVGGLLFCASAWRRSGLPKGAIALFAAGLWVNLVLALLPAPDILQTLGTALRNAGLVGMGLAVLRQRRGGAA